MVFKLIPWQSLEIIEKRKDTFQFSDQYLLIFALYILCGILSLFQICAINGSILDQSSGRKLCSIYHQFCKINYSSVSQLFFSNVIYRSMCPDRISLTHWLLLFRLDFFLLKISLPQSPVPSFSLTFPPVLALAYTFACLIQNHGALKCIDNSTLQCKTRPRHCWQLKVHSTAR